MTVPANPTRKSIPRDDLIAWFECGWAYVMPDFDHPDHYIVEWLSTKAPVEPRRVPEISKEAAEG